MDVTSVLVGLLGGGVIGAIFGAVYTTAHERTERFRDRLLAGAEQLLTTYDEALVAFDEYRYATSDFFLVTHRVTEAAERAERARSDVAPEDAPDAAAYVLEPIEALGALTDQLSFRGSMPDETRAVAQTHLTDAEQRLAATTESFPPELTDALAAFIQSSKDFTRAGDEQRNAYARWHSAYAKIGSVLPRIIVLFTFSSRDETVRAAYRLSNELGNAGGLVGSEWGAGRDPGVQNESVAAQLDRVNATVGDFARAANSDIRRRWL